MFWPQSERKKERKKENKLAFPLDFITGYKKHESILNILKDNRAKQIIKSQGKVLLTVNSTSNFANLKSVMKDGEDKIR